MLLLHCNSTVTVQRPSSWYNDLVWRPNRPDRVGEAAYSFRSRKEGSGAVGCHVLNYLVLSDDWRVKEGSWPLTLGAVLLLYEVA